jgi:uncharacterized protein (TIGR00725 family)
VPDGGRAWIAVVGPGEADQQELALAETVGAEVAAAGAVLVCGGLGGVMEAACRGARSRGGTTVGLLPGSDRAAANGWVQIAIPTGLGEGRNALVVRSADALVAVGGGWGTLSEIALALKAGRSVIGIGSWELARDGQAVEGIVAMDDPADAVAAALARVS